MHHGRDWGGAMLITAVRNVQGNDQLESNLAGTFATFLYDGWPERFAESAMLLFNQSNQIDRAAHVSICEEMRFTRNVLKPSIGSGLCCGWCRPPTSCSRHIICGTFAPHSFEICLQLLHIENAADFNPFLATKFILVKVWRLPTCRASSGNIGVHVRVRPGRSVGSV